MKLKICYLIVAFLSIAPWQFGQHVLPKIDARPANQGGEKSSIQKTELAFKIDKQEMDTDWNPVLTHVVHKHSRNKDEAIEQLKAAKTATKFNTIPVSSQETHRSAGLVPVVGSNFLGNVASGSCPMDNTVAISNGGKIVSMVNSNISYYDQNGTLLYSSDLWTWANNSSLPSSICDPKVIYDSGADRFIMYAQTCDGVPANSKVILGFSQSNDPQQGWWLYFLTGNPLGDGSWFDYPKIAVSTEEVYVTGNLFDANGNYSQSVIYQVEKNDGYAGNSLDWQYWHSIAASPFTLLPVSYGQQGTVGPGVLLVSTINSSSGSSQINLYQINDYLSATNETLNHWAVSTPQYSAGGDAAQQGGVLLNTGDNRTMSGFFMDGTIHFVFHSDIGNGWNGINYNRLDINTLTNVSTTFGLQGTYDYCYPAVASISNSPSDHSVVIGFERSGATVYPEYRVVSCDDNLNWSASQSVKSGQSAISACGTPERWGDYTGISRWHSSSTPKVWIAGAYANANNYWGNWIAEIGLSGSVGANEGINDLSSENGIRVSPNPTTDIFYMQFDAKKVERIEIDILDASQARIKSLFSGYCAPGENVFSFNKGQLADGLYYIRISTESQNIYKYEKLVVLH
jgi:hypothetical protein